LISEKKTYIRNPKKLHIEYREHNSNFVRFTFYRTTLHYVFVDRNALSAKRRNCAHGILFLASGFHPLSLDLECYHGAFFCAPTSSQKHSDSATEKQQTSTRNSGSACPFGDRIQQESNTHCGYQRTYCFGH
jgi:hypothetical protein